MTKEQRISNYKKDYPELFKQVNEDRLKLDDDEYNQVIESWVNRDLEREADEQAKADAEAKKESGKAKLKALGLSDAEIEALVG